MEVLMMSSTDAVIVKTKKEKLRVLENNAVQQDESQPTFRWNIYPSCCLFHDAFWIELLLVSEEGGDMILRNLVDFHQISRRYILED
jgi:hypothetical protein